MKRCAWCLCAAVLVGCGGTTMTDGGAETSVVTDAAVDAAPEAAPSEAGADAMVCDLGTAPTGLPRVTSRVLFDDSDAGVQTTPMGGNPQGTWAVTDITMVLPAVARGQVNAAASHLDGTAWVSFTAADYRINFDTVLTLSTTVAGDVVRGVMSSSRGTYTVNGAQLMLTPQCSSAANSGVNATRMGFTQDAPDRGRAFINLSGATGTLLLVTTLSRLSGP